MHLMRWVNPVREMTDMAHKFGAVVLIDGAQGVPHMSVDVREIGCDFYVFSGHKLLHPLGSESYAVRNTS